VTIDGALSRLSYSSLIQRERIDAVHHELGLSVRRRQAPQR
jgi:hypothetical protein